MSSLVYLVVVSAKNRLLELIRKPAKLVLYLLVIGAMVGTFIISILNGSPSTGFLDIVWLKGIVFALILLFFCIAIAKGLNSGDMIFDMSDVNFLFVSPVKPQSILLYGVVRMMSMSFLAGFFILFQGSSLGTWFGIYFSDIFLILAGFILAVSLMQILSLLIYSLTNGKPKRKLIVKLIAVALFLPMIVNGVWQINQAGGDLTKALEALLRSPITSWTPVVGWAAEGTVSFISGDFLSGFLFFGIMVAAGALLITYILFSNPDYYEDVLVATETAFEKKRALAEGPVNAEAAAGKKIKVAATGIRGRGASAIFYKHLRESFRVNRFGLWGMQSVLTVSGAIAFAAFMRMNGADSGDGGNLVTLLQILMWVQMFMIGTGRGLKETYSHYIYLIPSSSFSKIVWSNLEVIFKVLVESIPLFIISGMILQEPPLVIAFAIVVYSLFALLLIGINYLLLRWTGADTSVGILIFIYIIAVILILLPGLIPAMIIGFTVEGWGVIAGLGILAAWELLAAFACFALSKGVLHRCDLPVMKTGK